MDRQLLQYPRHTLPWWRVGLIILMGFPLGCANLRPNFHFEPRVRVSDNRIREVEKPGIFRRWLNHRQGGPISMAPSLTVPVSGLAMPTGFGSPGPTGLLPETTALAHVAAVTPGGRQPLIMSAAEVAKLAPEQLPPEGVIIADSASDPSFLARPGLGAPVVPADSIQAVRLPTAPAVPGMVTESTQLPLQVAPFGLPTTNYPVAGQTLPPGLPFPSVPGSSMPTVTVPLPTPSNAVPVGAAPVVPSMVSPTTALPSPTALWRPAGTPLLAPSLPIAPAVVPHPTVAGPAVVAPAPLPPQSVNAIPAGSAPIGLVGPGAVGVAPIGQGVVYPAPAPAVPVEVISPSTKLKLREPCPSPHPQPPLRPGAVLAQTQPVHPTLPHTLAAPKTAPMPMPTPPPTGNGQPMPNAAPMPSTRPATPEPMDTMPGALDVRLRTMQTVVRPGDQVYFTIELRNQGETPLAAVELVALLSDNLKFEVINPGDLNIQASGQTIQFPTLTNIGTQTFTYIITAVVQPTANNHSNTSPDDASATAKLTVKTRRPDVPNSEQIKEITVRVQAAAAN